ncbi:5-methylcytosine-specific restriction endonuclease McrA [Sphingopyxis panaciterrae]|uniref:HNH endonuclease n=1 Tax=Sphingopyxis panaciterrae TaxID=363841 RepID=UPI00141F9A76|nr:HNH endonuclease signature motif containing protein [Sphingopyxis panaciterrae]NIJ37906.1 5-methylcytosine-specific restriction endonuclease McrA [Sphingopyxis panaciterrae]
MGKLTALGSRVATLPPRVAVPAKRADTLYTSPEWRALVRAIKAARGPYCERCGSSHRVAGDHIVEVKDGGAPLDAANVELLCQSCHNRKTAAARAKRAGLA